MDIRELLAQKRPAPGQTVVAVRVEAASRTWDGIEHMDADDAAALVANKLGVYV